MVELTIFIVGSFLFKDNYSNKKVMFFSLSWYDTLSNFMAIIYPLPPYYQSKLYLAGYITLNYVII